MALLVEGDLPVEWYDAAIVARTVGMDIETSGLDVIKDKIATVQLYVPNKGTIIVRKLDNPFWLGGLLESPLTTKIFHHAPFDLGFLIRDLGIWPQAIADTKIAAKLIDPKKTRFIHPTSNKGSHALISLVYHFHDIVLDKTQAVSNWFVDTLDPKQLDYAEKDVIYLPEMLAKMEQEILESGDYRLLRNVYNGIVPKVILNSKNIEDIYGY